MSNLIDPSALGQSLRALGAARQQAMGDKQFMKMTKQGVFLYGIEENTVPDNELWAVNPDSFKLGVIGWQGGTVVGEDMVPIGSVPIPRIQDQEPIKSKDPSDGWKEQLSFEMKQVDGEAEVLFKTSSVGGISAGSKLAGQIGMHLQSEPGTPIAAVTLTSESYKHKKFGTIFNPVFTVLSWLTAEGEPAKKALV
jgi:hypothetical protein